jgi:diadenosine tetraphosphate (Ap4A) HIT family hydrolase
LEWPEIFYAYRRGEGCPICAEGRPEETAFGVRVSAGDVSDAYLQRDGRQRGYTVVSWRGRHIVEPTELTAEEACRYWLEVLSVGRAIEAAFEPVKVNYETLGNAVPHLHTHVMPRYADDPRPGFPLPHPAEPLPPHPEQELRRDASTLRALLGHS